MNKVIGTAVACLAVGTSMLPSAAAAQHYNQRFHHQDRVIEDY